MTLTKLPLSQHLLYLLKTNLRGGSFCRNVVELFIREAILPAVVKQKEELMQTNKEERVKGGEVRSVCFHLQNMKYGGASWKT